MRARFLIVSVIALWLSAAPQARAVLLVGPGQTYTTVQACANAANAGDTCRVLAAGSPYAEYVVSQRNGTAANPITFKAENSSVSIGGFFISHSNHIINGFDITGHTTANQGAIQINLGGNNCQILNNNIHDTVLNVYGISFQLSAGGTPSGCIIQGNTIEDIFGIYLNLSGQGHTVVYNRFRVGNSWDFIRLFGEGHYIARNSFLDGEIDPSSGLHPDMFQNFAIGTVETPSIKSINHVFVENFLCNQPSQIGQIHNGNNLNLLFSNITTMTIERNVFCSFEYNFNMGVPNVTHQNNSWSFVGTTTVGDAGFGMAISGDLVGGTPVNHINRSNMYLASGSNGASNLGWYNYGGFTFSINSIRTYVTAGNATVAGQIATDLWSVGGYLTSAQLITSTGRALVCNGDDSNLTLSGAYAAYKALTYQYLCLAVAFDIAMRATFDADYNFVAGRPVDGYPAKNTTGCAGVTTPQRFCEPNGINGGDPMLQDVTNPLGPDGIPFTLDDGLKPLPGSPLCNAGAGGVTIGAYSCDPSKVFVSEDTPLAGPVRTRRRPGGE
jgi:hypothetical protein